MTFREYLSVVGVPAENRTEYPRIGVSSVTTITIHSARRRQVIGMLRPLYSK
jgi:hypothetical protein